MSAKRTRRDVAPELEKATYAVETAAGDRGILLTALDAVTLASAALESFDGLVVVEDDTSIDLWDVQESRDALRRRLRDRAAVQALDDGYTITACPRETVVGLGPAGEAVPLAEAATAVVTHAYQVRVLGRARAGAQLQLGWS